MNSRTNYHVEALWADAVIPNWYTTPSYPPFPLISTTIMEVAANHPGRQDIADGQWRYLSHRTVHGPLYED